MTLFAPLREQLRTAAAEFAGEPGVVAEILTGMVDDVDRALREKLEIFPVCHHSPASGLAMVRRLREKQPKVIYLELCEDMRPMLDELRNCTLPVAVQAWAGVVESFPAAWAPLSVVAPITEASAEYQAISYALTTPGVELVCVDRSTDHIFQWMPRNDEPASAEPGPMAAEPESVEPTVGETKLHGDAVGIEIGDLRPHFAELEAHLLHHGKVRHWSEWWDQYVEQPLSTADYDTYRQVMVLIGSLFRRLRTTGTDRDEDRERYMWTRMREHLNKSGADPASCLYVCGAFHAASRVEQFGLESQATFEIDPPTGTTWQYGLIPSSHSAIEAQFGLAAGSVSIAAATWSKGVKRSRVRPFALAAGSASGMKAAAKKAVAKAAPPDPSAGPVDVADQLSGFLSTPPRLDTVDEAELLEWSVDIVRLARRNGYLASTADAIAIYETSILLAGMRERARPTPYDFQDAAITCIEKDRVPGRRDVRRLCEILLGGDRIGRVGYDALPPLARDVYDRLATLGIDPANTRIQRTLLDLDAAPQLRPGSDLLWMLRRLLPGAAVRPIMGSRGLGERSIQESWDVAIGKYQRDLVELGYEGVTVEQVLEQRLRSEVNCAEATAASALAAVEDALVYLGSVRLADELGGRAVELLTAERTVDGAPEVLRRIRALIDYYRATDTGLPGWCGRFVTAGYAHYCTLLPTAFIDDATGVRSVAAMLGFLFGMENLALSLGCDHSQLELAVQQSHPEPAAKVALLWATRLQLGMLTLPDLRERCDDMLANPLVVPAFPQYLSGFIQAMDPVPSIKSFVVEQLSKAFGRLPDAILLPWLPSLITTLRSQAGELIPALTREAGRTFPGDRAGIEAFIPPWSRPQRRPAGTGPAAAPGGPAAELLRAHPAACDAYAMLLGHEGEWQEIRTGSTPAASALLAAHPETASALAELLSAQR
ncbi:DUF5682 family protein [Nocardia donostiensis]|uniref:Uncharacterized protein n=1 Tax=Nocardia donostiensis TaxID=1538463 RepID=A0A1W0BI60_9NOCA|nr:DUF5682 family protein [Nocardia donostiensis]ONM49887.1 hypothetical protein B0T46_05770 [Nocardia donostiensis]OQS22163.1 hypothetical protein B0T44_05770 [Nocardia donostiensis]